MPSFINPSPSNAFKYPFNSFISFLSEIISASSRFLLPTAIKKSLNPISQLAEIALYNELLTSVDFSIKSAKSGFTVLYITEDSAILKGSKEFMSSLFKISLEPNVEKPEETT